MDPLAQLRRVLTELRRSRSEVGADEGLIIAGVITQFREIEVKIEQCAGGKPAPNVPKLNSIVSRQIDDVYEISLKLKNEIGG